MSDAPTLEALQEVHQRFDTALASARSLEDHLSLRSEFLGPKGALTRLARGVRELPPEQRREAGQRVNRVKGQVEQELDTRIAALEREARQAELRKDPLDLTLPGRPPAGLGGMHPTTQSIEVMIELFTSMGFEIATGPEVETDWYNFEALNFPSDHPARDMQDTFFVEPQRPDTSLVLRTHTSPVQVRTLLNRGAPTRIISPGRVFRCDSDATHSPSFFQIEGLWVDEGISMAHLKGVLQSFINGLFGERPARFRPSFFPFVEPGVEVDMQCVFCEGEGCRVCKQTGWIEILGAGMVHPAVLKACRVDPERYTGFAFGLGADRVAMLRYRVDDLGHFFRGDMRVLEQFQ